MSKSIFTLFVFLSTISFFEKTNIFGNKVFFPLNKIEIYGYEKIDYVEKSEYLANALSDKDANEIIYRMNFDSKNKLQEFKEKLDKQKSVKKINTILN